MLVVAEPVRRCARCRKLAVGVDQSLCPSVPVGNPCHDFSEIVGIALPDLGYKVVYIAGKFRAKTHWATEQNIRKAEDMAMQVWQAGMIAFCPHVMGRFLDKTVEDSVILPMARAVMHRCDAVLLVPGWEDSEGTQDECFDALQLGIPIFDHLEALTFWKATNQDMHRMKKGDHRVRKK